MRAIAILLCALGLVLAQSGSEPAAMAVERGKRLFGDTQGLEYPSCAQCHNTVPAKEEARKAKHLGPGGTLYGSVVREGWRNRNTYKDVGEASQICAKYWQQRKGGLKAAQRADLIAFLATITPKGPLPLRKVQEKPRLMDKLDGGDREKGRKLTERYCVNCHNEESVSFKLKPGKRKKALIARKVRGYNSKRQFKPREVTMSYYTNERLSDQDLRHILAHLGR